MKSRFLSLAVLALVAGWASGPARAEPYPARAVRVLSGFPPGGGSDIVARAIAGRLAERWGKPVVVDNRAGGGGTIAMTITAQSAPDGYTLMILSGSQITNAALFTALPFDMTRALEPVIQVTSQSYLLMAHPAVGVTSVSDLVQLARAKPGVLNFGSAGAGSVTHLGMELLSLQAGIQLTHVPYKGSGQVLTELLGNHVQLALATTISGITHYKSGRLRVLASTGRERARALPQVPTVAQSGVPGYELTGWYGVVAPAGTPRAVVARLNQDIDAVVREKDVQDRFAADGAEPVGGTVQAFAAVIRGEVDKWSQLVKARGIKA